MAQQTMTKAPERPRDLNQWAKRVVDIATGEIEDRAATPEEQGKDSAAVSLARPGVRQRLGEARDRQAGGRRAVGDRLDDPRQEESQRRKAADMALGETFGGGDVVERFGPASNDR